MTNGSRCDDWAEAILDDAAPRPEGLAEHLASCPDCRGLVAAHRAASALPGPPPGVDVARPQPVLEGEVLARVERRRATRLVGAGVAVAAIVAVVLVPARRAPEVERPGGDLFALADGIAELIQRDPLEDDPALRHLGAVSDWLAPPRTRSLGLDSIVRPPALRAPRGDVP